MTVFDSHAEAVRCLQVGKARSQTWRWFAGSLCLYLTDKATSWLNIRQVSVSAAIVSEDGSTVVMHLDRPWDWSFLPGQYALLQIQSLDATWHPFSIGSDPGHPDLRFLVEVKGPGSWTARLAEVLRGHPAAGAAGQGSLAVNLMGPYGSSVGGNAPHYASVLAIGTGTGVVPMLSLLEQRASRLRLLGKSALAEASHREAAFRISEHLARSLGRSKPVQLVSFQTQRTMRRNHTVNVPDLASVESGAEGPAEGGDAEAGGEVPAGGRERSPSQVSQPISRALGKGASYGHDEITGAVESYSSGIYAAVLNIQLRWRLKALRVPGRSAFLGRLRREALQHRVHPAMDLLALGLIAAEAGLLSLTISWANLPAPLHGGTEPMQDWLEGLMWFQALFFCLHVVYRWACPGEYNASSMLAIDSLFGIGTMVAMAVWKEEGFHPASNAVTNGRIFLSLYRLLRLVLLNPFFRSEKSNSKIQYNGDLLDTEHFQLVWVVRSADLLAGVLPELCHVLDSVFDNLYTRGPKKVDQKRLRLMQHFLRVRVYCTEKDAAKVARVEGMLAGSALDGSVTFGRPDLKALLKQHMQSQLIDGMQGSVRLNNPKHSFVTYCGSPNVAAICSDGARDSNVMAATAGFTNYKYVFREEFYGGAGAYQ